MVVNLSYRNSPGTLALQQSDERSPERSIEDGVDDRIDRGGHVAEPQAYVDHVYRHRALGTRGEEYVQEKERGPAEHEHEENQAQHLAGFLLRCNGVRGQRSPLRSTGEKPENTGDIACVCAPDSKVSRIDRHLHVQMGFHARGVNPIE